MSIITCYKISPRSVAYEGKLKKGGGSQARTDALANLGTILGGGLVLATRNALPDLIVGAAVSIVVLYGSFEIIRDAALEPSEAGAKQT
jgi:divalent metal cation (Fe/Co/Zn/Cd) transporter